MHAKLEVMPGLPHLEGRKRLVVAFAAALISLPSLRAGLFDDDFWQRHFLLDHLSGVRNDGWWLLYGVPLAAGAVPALVYGGFLPWWTSARFQLSFFRPLSAATHFIDYRLWPDAPWAMHAQNTLWYVALCLLVLALYRRVLGNAAALLAAVLYAVDDAQLDAVAWVAARNSLLTAVFGVLTLLLLDGAARARSRGLAVLAALSLALAHASSEGAVAVWAYVIPGAFFLHRVRWRAAIAGLVPCAAVTAGFVIVTGRLHYGAVGGGAYIDPRVRPLEFGRAVAERLPRLIGEEFGPPAWLTDRLSAFAWTYVLVCVLSWVVVAIAARGILREPMVRAALTGAAGSALIVCTARPEPRLLLMVGVGAHAVLGTLLVSLHRTWREGARASRGRTVAVFGLAWVGFLHLVLAPVGAFAVPESYRARHRARMESAGHMALSPGDANRVVAVLNTPSYFDAVSICTYRLEHWPHSFRVIHILGASETPVTLARSGPNSLTLTARGGYLLEKTMQQARTPDEPFAPGQSTLLDGLVVVVEAVTEDGRPERVRFDFFPDQDRRPRFLSWNASAQTFEQIELPKEGEQVVL